MEINEYTLERLAFYWIRELKDAGRKEAWKVREGITTVDGVQAKHREKVAYFFNELAREGGEGVEAINRSFDAVHAKAKRIIGRLGS